MPPLVNILYYPGTQCERETQEAYKLAGFETRLVFINDLLTGKLRITDCAVCHIPGGFSYMDSIRVGSIAAAVARDYLPKLKEQGIPTCGVCNGFQIMVEAGMFGPELALTVNDCGTFVSKPVLHKIIQPFRHIKCVWTYGLEGLLVEFPAAHGSGKLVSNSRQIIDPNAVMVYEGRSPNGGGVAGITDDTGLFFGLMDHWERPYDNPAGQLILSNLRNNL